MQARRSEADALAVTLEELPDGVLFAPLPTPFLVGPVNCWLLPEPPVTIIDPGMVYADSLRVVDDLLAEAQLTVADIDQVVVTHAHPDHFGAAGLIAEQSGAPLLCGRPETLKLRLELDQRSSGTVLEDLGLPTEMREQITAAAAEVTDFVHRPTPEMLTPLDDRARIEAGGRTYDVHLTPGHAAGHISLWNGETLFSGDHLLPRITPNPLLEFDDTVPGGRRRSLVEYLDSLDRFCALDPDTALPGHDEPFSDVGRLVANIRAHHQGRAQAILERVGDLGTPTAFELSRVLFPDLQGFGIMLGLSEAIGHLDLLEDAGKVRKPDESPHRYSAM